MSKVVGVFEGSKNSCIDSILSELFLVGFNKNDISILTEDFSFEKSLANIPENYMSRRNTNTTLIGANTTFDKYNQDIYFCRNIKSFNSEDKELSGSVMKGGLIGGLSGLLISLFILFMIPDIFNLLISESALTIISSTVSMISLGIILGTIRGLMKFEYKDNKVIAIVHSNKVKEELVKEIFKRHSSSNIRIFN